MRKYLITLNIVLNGRKITAIRDLRAATGMGLIAAKTFTETVLDATRYVDSFGGTLIVSGDQLAAIYMLTVRKAEYVDNGFGPCVIPTFHLDKVEEYNQAWLDISDLLIV